MPGAGGRPTRRAPASGARGLELSGICEGPEFIGRGLEAVRRVRRFAALLRGDLLKRREMCRGPTVEQEAAGDCRGGDRCDGGNGGGR